MPQATAPALVQKAPITGPLTTLAACVRDWIARVRNGPLASVRDQVIPFTASSPDLETAIRRACESKCIQGKTCNHQSKVPIALRREYADVLVRNIDRMEATANFEEMHDLMTRLRFKGIGPVTTYDAAIRIGAYRGMQPAMLHVKAGVRHGLDILVDRLGPVDPYWGKASCVEVDPQDLFTAYPPLIAFQDDIDEMEDFICGFKEGLSGIDGMGVL